MHDSADTAGRRQVVVVGAGFGGLRCARHLAGEPDVAVTVVDRHNFHTFLPLLYQVATCGLNSGDIAHPARGILRRYPNVDFRHGAVRAVDAEHRVVTIGADEVPYDDLVLAAGSRPHFFGVDGAAEHTLPLYSLPDAVTLRNHLLGCFEAAAVDRSLVDEGALTAVVVGAGPTGVETSGALAELFDKVLQRDFPHLDVGRSRVVLLERSDAVLGAFGDRSQEHALETLRARGVDVRLGVTVRAVDDRSVTLEGDERIPTRTVIWAAGVQATALTGSLDVELDRGGRVVVAPDLSVPGRDGLWAIGDAAHITDAAGRTLPQLAQVAIQSGDHAAEQLLHRARGRPTEPFRYLDKGIMATVGRRAAVVELPYGLRMRGGIAWLAWLGLHLVTLLGMRNRLSVLVNWAWNYTTWDRGPRLIFDTEIDRSRVGDDQS